MRDASGQSTTSSRARSVPIRCAPSGESSMDDQVRAAVAGQEAYVVGGAVRDELLGREVVDLDVACQDPEAAARSYAKVSGGAIFPLSERHGAWRVAFRSGRTVD